MQLLVSFTKAYCENQVHSLTIWSKEWDMEINIDKCRFVSIIYKKICSKNKHKMSGITLKSSNQNKYLIVTSTKKLSWLPHVNVVNYQSFNSN